MCLQVKDREYFPADLVLFSSTNPEGICYIETMNLDGETNLKMKKALQESWDIKNEVHCMPDKTCNQCLRCLCTVVEASLDNSDVSSPANSRVS